MVVVSRDGGIIAPFLCPRRRIGVVVIVFLEGSGRGDAAVRLLLWPGVAVKVPDRRLASIQGEICAAVGLVLAVEVHQPVGVGRTVDVHVHVHARCQAVFRVVPLGQQYVTGIIGVRPGADFPPELDGLLLAGIALDQAVGHIHSESVHSFVIPERDDIQKLTFHGTRPRSIHSLLPGTGRVRMGKAKVEGRLAGIEVLVVEFVARVVAFHPFSARVLHIIRILEHLLEVPGCFLVRQPVAPDEIVRITQVGVLRTLDKPGVLVGSVPGDQVQQHLDAALVGLVDQFQQVVVGAEARVHTVVVDDVVAAVYPPGFEEGVEPDGRYPQALDIVHLGQNALDVSDSVPVGILVGRRVDLVDDGILEPLRTLCPGLLE